MQPPKRLKNNARKKWVETFADFTPASAMDVEAACQYCEQWSIYLDAMADITEHGRLIQRGTGGLMENPMIGAQRKAMQLMEKIRNSLSPLLGKVAEDGDDFSDLEE
jgi:P27 family predicted phage terminase small subunit